MNSLIYSEKAVEEVIKRYPEAFLGTPLILKGQQVSLDGFRPDLIFETPEGIPVIVEIQLNALDRLHFYKSLEYRDLYRQQYGRQPRVILVCNEIGPRHAKLLTVHGVECRVITRTAFIERALALNPSLRFKVKRPPKLPLTAGALLKEITRPLKQRLIRNMPGVVFWLPPRHANDWSDWRDLRSVRRSGVLYFNDYGCFLSKDNKRLDRGNVPRQIIVSENIATLTVNELRAFSAWLELLGKYSQCHEFVPFDVVFGWRGSIDLYNYDGYIQNRIKVFEAVLRDYRLRTGYDKQRIDKDLRLFNQLLLYAGQAPNLEPVKMFEHARITADAGPLMRNWEDYKRWGDPKRIKIIEEDSRRYNYEWATVYFDGLCSNYVQTMGEVVEHLLIHHVEWKSKKLLPYVKCFICLSAPRRLADLRFQGIQLASRYFAHFRNPLYVHGAANELRQSANYYH